MRLNDLLYCTVEITVVVSYATRRTTVFVLMLVDGELTTIIVVTGAAVIVTAFGTVTVI